MKYKMKLIFSAALAVVLIVLPRSHAATANASTDPALTSAGTNANPDATMTALFGDPVIAKGKGFEIKQSELDQVLVGLRAAAAARNQTIPPDQMTLIEGQMLNRLIQIQLLLQEANDADRAQGKKMVDLQMSVLLEHAGSQEALDHQFKALGMTADELRGRLTQEATAQSVLERELGVTVTDAEIKKFYEDHPEEFEQPEMVHVRHIVLSTVDPTTGQPLPADQQALKRKQIDDLLKRARKGEDFSKLATQYSEDPGSKEKGGELNAFPRGTPGVPPEFEAAAFSLTNNQISDVVTSQYGYHIIQLLDKTPAKKLALTDKVTLSDKTTMTVADSIKKEIIQEKTVKLAPAYLDNLKKAAGVEITDADLKAAAAAAEASAASASSGN
jgi:peptidyl-prolyl cis-trans isomerase C